MNIPQLLETSETIIPPKVRDAVAKFILQTLGEIIWEGLCLLAQLGLEMLCGLL